MKTKYIFAVLFSMLCSQAMAQHTIKRSKKNREKDFAALINKPKLDYSHSIRLDGCYQNITMRHIADSELYDARIILPHQYLVHPQRDTIFPENMRDPNRVCEPVFFFNNGVVAVAGDCDTFTSMATRGDERIYKKASRFEWGTYEINHDTISAMIFVPYGSYGPAYQVTYFAGIVKDSVTIVNWREIPPYHTGPDNSTNKWDVVYDQRPRIPQTLTFLPCPRKSNVDSTRSWIYHHYKAAENK